jgi:hypothetical protein
MTQAVLKIHKKDLIREVPNFQRNEFLYRLKRADYEREWGKDYKKPGFGTDVLAVLVRVLTLVTPGKREVFRDPTPVTEDLYITSINATVDDYKAELKAAQSGTPVLENTNLDSGVAMRPGVYPLADDTYAELVDRLAAGNFAAMTPTLRQNILDYYANPSVNFDTKRDATEWQKVMTEVQQMKAAPVMSAAE